MKKVLQYISFSLTIKFLNWLVGYLFINQILHAYIPLPPKKKKTGKNQKFKKKIFKEKVYGQKFVKNIPIQFTVKKPKRKFKKRKNWS